MAPALMVPGSNPKDSKVPLDQRRGVNSRAHKFKEQRGGGVMYSRLPDKHRVLRRMGGLPSGARRKMLKPRAAHSHRDERALVRLGRRRGMGRREPGAGPHPPSRHGPNSPFPRDV